jgi:IS4 transposase
MVTRERIDTLEEAYEYAGYYMQRWEIERFQYVLKSGCAVEKLQEGV